MVKFFSDTKSFFTLFIRLLPTQILAVLLLLSCDVKLAEQDQLLLSFNLSDIEFNEPNDKGANTKSNHKPDVSLLAGSQTGQEGNVPSGSNKQQTDLLSSRFGQSFAAAYNFRAIYVTDTSNSLIKKINLSNNEVTVFAGSGSLGPLMANVPRGNNKNLFNGSLTNAVDDVHKLNISNPTGIAVDTDYVYFISHQGRISRLRKDLSPTLVKEVYFAGGDAPKNDKDNQKKIIKNKGYLKHQNIKLSDPSNIVYHQGYIYVADTGNKKVKRISLHFDDKSQREVLLILEPDNHSFQSPSALAFLNDDLYISDSSTHKIFKISKPSYLSAYNKVEHKSQYVAGSGANINSAGSLKTAGISKVVSMVSDKSKIYAASNQVNGQILVIDTAQDEVSFLEFQTSKPFALAPSTSFNFPSGLTYDFFNDRFYLIEQGLHRILQISIN